MQQQEEFIQLIQECEPMIHKVCYLYADESDDRKDLFQEIVMQVWIAIPKFKGLSKQSTWLYRIALNTALAHQKKRKRFEFWKKESPRENIFTEPEYHEEIKVFYKMITILPALEKALVLLYLEDYSYKEIAEVIGISESNVGTRLSRIKEKLKKQASSYI